MFFTMNCRTPTNLLRCLAAAAFSLLAGPVLLGASSANLSFIEGLYPKIEALYKELHQTPELSRQEEKTSAKLATELRTLGFDVTERVGGWGVVGVLKNGAGPRVLVRTEMDALPVEEKTGVAYASHAIARDSAEKSVPVMHACGHDIHMSEWVATAMLLAQTTNSWRGTIVFIAQPAEELGNGADAMLKDGLYERFGRPDVAFALHDTPELPAGQIGFCSGYCFANVDSVDITFFGKGGHGAYPHKTIDPIVIGSRFVTSVQTVVSRDNDPLEPAVITVGSFHAGSKHNIISDEARLQLTVRSYKPEVRKKLLDGIERVAKAEAAAVGALRPPTVALTESTLATYNDPELTRRLVETLKGELGANQLVQLPPTMGGEDFSLFGQSGVPACMLAVGASNPARFAAAKAAGESLPSLHSPLFLPDYEPTLKTGIRAMSAAVLSLLGKP